MNDKEIQEAITLLKWLIRLDGTPSAVAVLSTTDRVLALFDTVVKATIIVFCLAAVASPVMAQEYAPIILIDVSPPMTTPMIPMQFPTPPPLFAPAPVYVSPFINGVVPGVPMPVQFNRQATRCRMDRLNGWGFKMWSYYTAQRRARMMMATQAMVDRMRANPETCTVVFDEIRKVDILSRYPDLDGRIFTVDEMARPPESTFQVLTLASESPPPPSVETQATD
jgi:hypothetical protein